MHGLLMKFAEACGAQMILRDWEDEIGLFWQVCPREMLSRLENPLSEDAEAARA